MGIKVYIQDDLGRDFTNHEWAISDTKALADILLQKNYFKVIESYFQIDFIALDKVQYFDQIEKPEDRLWFPVWQVIEDVKSLKRVMKPPESPSGISPFVRLNQIAFDIFKMSEPRPDFSIDYFIFGYFILDLEDLERLLYYLLHSGAKQVHFYCS
jgi:hypothetical protein